MPNRIALKLSSKLICFRNILLALPFSYVVQLKHKRVCEENRRQKISEKNVAGRKKNIKQSEQTRAPKICLCVGK